MLSPSGDSASHPEPAPPVEKVVFLGSFLPRHGPWAAAGTHLFNAFASEFAGCECLGVAVSDVPRRYPYPSRVRFEIVQADQASYAAAAEFINLSDIDLVCIQHDFTVFDGEAGGYVLALLERLKPPVVSVLHQVPDRPDPGVLRVIGEIARTSACLVAADRRAGAVLQEAYQVPAEKLAVLDFPRDVGDQNLPEAPAWRELARRLMDCFQRCLGQPPAGFIPPTGSDRASDVLPLNLNHYLRLTDQTGILKASVYSLPDYHQGYTTADNANALVFVQRLEQAAEGPFIPTEMRAARHLAFLWNAFDPSSGRFHSALRYDRSWDDEDGSEEAHSLVLWALGVTLGHSTYEGIIRVARRLLDAALPAAGRFSSPLAWAYTLCGIREYLRRFPGDRAVQRMARLLLDRLFRLNREGSAPDWPWYGKTVGAGASRLPQAMLASWYWSGNPEALAVGLKTLDWLAGVHTSPKGYFSPASYTRGTRPALYPQRPAEALGMVSASLEAYRCTGDRRWQDTARRAFGWFTGHNDLGQVLYDAEMGACRDLLQPGHTRAGFGAAALLAFLQAQLELRLHDQRYYQGEEARPALPILHIGPPTGLNAPE